MPDPAPTAPHDSGDEALIGALRVSSRLLQGMMLLVLICYVFSGIFIVRQDEKAFVLVFGKVEGIGADRLRGPGLHWTLPRPFAKVERISTEQVQAVESATFWYHENPMEAYSAPPGSPKPPVTGPLRAASDGYNITADANLIHTRWALRYRISDPEEYLFRRADPSMLLRCELDHAVARSSVRFTVDQALRTDIEAFRSAVDEEVRRRCLELGLGIKVERVDLLKVTWPRQVDAAFVSVIESEQEASRRTSEARAQASRAVNEAHGDASRLRSEGEAYRRRVVSDIAAHAAYFSKVQEKYAKDPKLIGRTLLQDTLRRSLDSVEQKFIIQPNSSSQQELRLLLNPEPRPISQPRNR